jgi:hypothetical protein
MKVPYEAVRRHFPDNVNISREELYQWIGYPENINDPGFYNTCAIRVSLALLGAGFPSPGTYPVKAGKYKGKMIETRQRLLNKFLVGHLGKPEEYKGGPEAKTKIGARRGFISFFQLNGPTDNQGHIDLVAVDKWGYFRCEDGCYWGAVTVWFWPLP